LSYVLRHGAHEFGLTLDEHGFVPIIAVLKVMRDHHREISRQDIENIAMTDAKGRYEIVGDSIRARYGHSIPVSAKAVPAEPPDGLFHGTAGEHVQAILREGIRPMSRQFVHLSMTKSEAAAVGRRHSCNVVILKVHAKKAQDAGVAFVREGNIYLVKHVPPEFVEVTSID
jgi:putative RNA 2'-phosphotransferase